MIDFPSDALFEQLLPKLEIIMKNSPNPVRISSPAMGHQAGLYGAALTALDLALDSIELRKK